MFELVLTFVILGSAMDRPTFDQRTVTYQTEAQCLAARRDWMRRTDDQLPGMDPRYELLIGPSCRRLALVG